MSEELIQNGYLESGKLKGKAFGKYFELNIGATSISKLVKAGIYSTIPKSVSFSFTLYTPPAKPGSAKPDKIYYIDKEQKLFPIAVSEFKTPANLSGKEKLLYASEQGIFSASALGVNIAIVTDGIKDFYVDVEKSLHNDNVEYFSELRSFNPAVLDDLLSGEITTRDPAELSERVWQIIWHATKDEPKECLLTFVEVFLLKFLSDNLPKPVFANSFRFYELVIDTKEFEDKYGKTQMALVA